MTTESPAEISAHSDALRPSIHLPPVLFGQVRDIVCIVHTSKTKLMPFLTRNSIVDSLLILSDKIYTALLTCMRSLYPRTLASPDESQVSLVTLPDDLVGLVYSSGRLTLCVYFVSIYLVSSISPVNVTVSFPGD